MVTCPYCNGTNLKKSGFNNSGTQRYFCKDCKRKFTPENSIVFVEKIKPKKRTKIETKTDSSLTCPRCKGHDCRKNGFTQSGSQRYVCKTCKKEFIKGISYEKPEISCPYCKSEDLVKFGKNENGVKRFRCNSCKKTFLEHYRTPEKRGIKPPKSEFIENIRKDFLSGISIKEIAEKVGKSERTIRNYTKDLRKDKTPLLFKPKSEKEKIKKELENQPVKKSAEKQAKPKKTILVKKPSKEELKEQEKLKHIEEVKKRDMLELKHFERLQKIKQTNELKKQAYEKRREYINSIEFNRRDLMSDESKNKLNHLFTKYLKELITKDEFDACLISIKKEVEEQIALALEIEKSHIEFNIKKDILSGHKLTNVAKKYNMQLEDIIKRAEEYYKTETISEAQKRLIIQYGIIMNTPVEYVAPYVPCSERMFYKVLSENKDIKYNLGKIKYTDVRDDDTVLNGFIPKDKYIKALD